MSNIQQLKRIMDKVQRLQKRLDQVQKENERLRSELLPAKEREAKLHEHIAALEQQVMVLKAGTGKLTEVEKKELDKKLHGYLKEIDRCITMLSE